MSVDLDIEQPTNIKTVILPETPKTTEPPFVVERDVPDWIWKKSLKLLSEYADNPSGPGFTDEIAAYCELATHMLILFPERKGELNLLPLEEVRDRIAHFHTPAHLSELRLMYPDQFNNSPDQVTSPLSNMREPFSEIHPVDMAESITDTWGMFIQYPEKFEEIKKTPGLRWALISMVDMEKEQQDWYRFSFYKLMTRVFGFQDEDISKDEWEAMLEHNPASESAVPEFYIRMAAYMKLLTAKEVKMTEEGLAVVMREPVANFITTPQVPQTKKY